MKTKTSQIALAACSTELNGNVPTEIQLTPAGTFKAKDGRPVGLSGWVLTNENAQAVVQLANAQSDAFVVDYEHQTLYAKQNGQPAPAAGWFSRLEYREGLGLFATQVEWTDSAALAIQNKEYRYISPVLSYDKQTGEVTKIHMAALTNNPALDSMKDLCALAADYFQQPTEALSVDLDELLERLRYLFNLPTLATVEEIKAQLEKLKTLMDASQSETAAASSLFNLLESKTMPENQTETVDLSQYVPIADVKALQEQLVALSSQIQDKEINETIEAALSDGRLLPTQKELAQKMGKQDLAVLKEFLSIAPKPAALSGIQTGGKAPEVVALNVKTPTGWDVDTEQVALHQQILAYQKEHNVDFTTAAIALGG